MLELRRLAMDNAALYALIRLYKTSEMPIEDWSHYAIITLAKQNTEIIKRAVDAEMRAYPKPMFLR